MRKLNREALVAALEGIGEDDTALYERYGYTSGQECPGVVLSGEHKLCALFLELGEMSIDNVFSHSMSLDDVKYMAMETNANSMGLDRIYYWPGYTLNDED